MSLQVLDSLRLTSFQLLTLRRPKPIATCANLRWTESMQFSKQAIALVLNAEYDYVFIFISDVLVKSHVYTPVNHRCVLFYS